MIIVEILSVENPYPEIEIRCKCYPYCIRNLQISRCGIDFSVLKNGCNDKKKKQQNPYECKKKCSHIKENYAPEEVHEKTCSIGGKSRVFLPFRCCPCFVNHRSTDAHEYEKHSPDYRKQKRRRRQRGSCNFFVDIHVSPCQQG